MNVLARFNIAIIEQESSCIRVLLCDVTHIEVEVVLNKRLAFYYVRMYRLGPVDTSSLMANARGARIERLDEIRDALALVRRRSENVREAAQ